MTFTVYLIKLYLNVSFVCSCGMSCFTTTSQNMTTRTQCTLTAMTHLAPAYLPQVDPCKLAFMATMLDSGINSPVSCLVNVMFNRLVCLSSVFVYSVTASRDVISPKHAYEVAEPPVVVLFIRWKLLQHYYWFTKFLIVSMLLSW